MVKVGSIFEIPLSGQRFAYGQYLCRDKMGPIIQVFKIISPQRPGLEEILSSGLMFPPIITGLSAAIKSGLWTVIGFKKITSFEYPGFISTFENEQTGEATIWYYWDGKQSIRLGPVLPDEYKTKEYLMVWSPYDVVHRIETGEYPFPYNDLILYNRFTPRSARS